MTASEYVAHIADTEPIEAVREEMILLGNESPVVRLMGYDEFVGRFWKEMPRRYAFNHRWEVEDLLETTLRQ